MSPININLANDDDNDKIIGLAEKCPQEGMITYFTNRTPRFNTLHRLLDKDPGTMLPVKMKVLSGWLAWFTFLP